MASEPEAKRPAPKADFAIRVVAGIGSFHAATNGQGLAGTVARQLDGSPYNPFISHRLSDSRSKSPAAPSRDTGWQGHHLRLEEADGSLLGARALLS